jgi:hypothetical protein
MHVLAVKVVNVETLALWKTTVRHLGKTARRADGVGVQMKALFAQPYWPSTDMYIQEGRRDARRKPIQESRISRCVVKHWRGEEKDILRGFVG